MEALLLLGDRRKPGDMQKGSCIIRRIQWSRTGPPHSNVAVRVLILGVRC